MDQPYHNAMPDDADRDAPAFDLPDLERVYRNYLATCRRLGVKPTPRDRAKALIEEWADTLAVGRSDPATTH